MHAESVVLVQAPVALQSTYARLAATLARIPVADRSMMFASHLMTIARLAVLRQRMESRLALIAQLAPYVGLAAALARLLVAQRIQRSLQIATALWKCKGEPPHSVKHSVLCLSFSR